MRQVRYGYSHRLSSGSPRNHLLRTVLSGGNRMSPETRQCQNCKTEFRIDTEDFAFYEKMKVPAPTFCPECRLQRRLAWRAGGGVSHRKNDRGGEGMISPYPPRAGFPGYCRE